MTRNLPVLALFVQRFFARTSGTARADQRPNSAEIQTSGTTETTNGRKWPLMGPSRRMRFGDVKQEGQQRDYDDQAEHKKEVDEFEAPVMPV